jgi:hypothetical protein
METGASIPFKVLTRLLADFRVCITGTPMSRMRAEDLYALFRFLCVHELGDLDNFWRKCAPGTTLGLARTLQVVSVAGGGAHWLAWCYIQNSCTKSGGGQYPP